LTDQDKTQDKLTIINELGRRRGFFWPSYEIYGGTSGFFTYGPLGAKLKQNIESKLRSIFVNQLEILEIESPVITPETVFSASGHVDHFKEPMTECQKCKKSFRADHLLREATKMSEAETEKLGLKELKEAIDKNNIRCPDCGGSFGEPKQFLTMFKTAIGPYSDAVGYGRPEAAQGIFVEFNRLYGIAREKLPFGVLQIGHALRNEISPRQGLMRLREFTIADLEFFFDPEEEDCHALKGLENETLRLVTAETRQKGSEEVTELTVKGALKKDLIKKQWLAFFMATSKRLLIDLGVPPEKQRFLEKLPWERAHYSQQTFDQEVLLDRWGWTEASGHAYRTDYDLRCHMNSSRTDMTVFKEYPQPIEKEQVSIKPIMAKLGPAFKGEAGKIASALAKADPAKIEVSMKKHGHYMLGEHKILAEYVDITSQRTIERGRRFIPHVIEPSFGIDRLFYIAMEYAYQVKENRALMSFPPGISPVQIGVYPLMSKDGLPEKTLELFKKLQDDGFAVEYDDAGSIGRRYARADEAGVPLGITVDYDTLKDGTVTVRDRDSWKQVRTSTKSLPILLSQYFRGKAKLEDLGKLI